MERRVFRHVVVLLTVLGAGVLVLMRPPIPQDPGYHEMADQRPALGMANGLNVLSNLPFALVGLSGLVVTFRRQGAPFEDPWVRWPYAAVFGGTALTAVGSAYYHLAPDNARLVWDRLPMTLAFMGLVAAVVAERVSVGASRVLFVPLLLAGAGSVAYWRWSELQGVGDLRPYVLVQFGSLVAVAVLVAVYPGREGDSRCLAAALLAYGCAKGLESADRWILDVGHVVSGHTLKHVAAAAGVGCLAAMLRARRSRASRATDR
jgi:hypothetical protein